MRYVNRATWPLLSTEFTRHVVIALLNRQSVSVVCSTLSKVLRVYHSSREYDRAFDGGEWSGPSGWRWLGRYCDEVIREAGWMPESLASEIVRRTSARWLHFSPLDEVFSAIADKDRPYNPS